MNIIMSCNAIWANTGYGTQARSLLTRLRDHGHNVANFAWYGLQGGMMKLDGVTVLPLGFDVWGNDISSAYGKWFSADLLITLMDVWVVELDFADKLHPTSWAAWAPVDHEPGPPQVFERWRKADYPIAYSLFGLQQAKNAGIDHVRYIPHGVECGIFRPKPKAECRERLKLPKEAFICSVVAANKGYPSRKCLSENIQAFARFAETHEDAVLYLHTLRTTNYGGLDIEPLVGALGIAHKTYYVDQLAQHLGLPNTYISDVYNASDVLLAASAGEGFGLPIAEAQACGCPVITTNWTSMRELTVNGVAIEPLQTTWTPLKSWCAVVGVERVRAAIESIYNRTTEDTAAAANAGVIAMRSNYDWDLVVARYWVPFLAAVAKDRAAGLGGNVVPAAAQTGAAERDFYGQAQEMLAITQAQNVAKQEQPAKKRKAKAKRS